MARRTMKAAPIQARTGSSDARWQGSATRQTMSARSVPAFMSCLRLPRALVAIKPLPSDHCQKGLEEPSIVLQPAEDPQEDDKTCVRIMGRVTYNILITFAGQPPTTALVGTSFVTTAPAATMAFSPTVTPGQITARAPIHAPLSMETGEQCRTNRS